LREDTRQQGTDKVMVQSVIIIIIKNNNKTAVNKAIKGNLPSITYTNKIAILNKYFPKSAINLSSLTPVV
jgi:hypothetical protein